MKHATGARQDWLAARVELLKAEKELTRQSDALVERRRQLPWVRIEKTYRFETEDGSVTLEDLFRGRSQLLIYDFMFGPDYSAGCQMRRRFRPRRNPRRDLPLTVQPWQRRPHCAPYTLIRRS